jgi:hypothetical protein
MASESAFGNSVVGYQAIGLILQLTERSFLSKPNYDKCKNG